MSLLIKEFGEWIAAEGGEVLPPTNKWEVLRYKTVSNATGIIYQNKAGKHTLTKQVSEDYPRFLQATGLAKTERVDRLKQHKNAKLKAELLERDGDACCYCGQFMDQPTLEHFHAISRHGVNHPDNCGLACEPCNKIAGNLSVIEKMKLRDRIRAEVAGTPPWETFTATPELAKASSA